MALTRQSCHSHGRAFSTIGPVTVTNSVDPRALHRLPLAKQASGTWIGTTVAPKKCRHLEAGSSNASQHLQSNLGSSGGESCQVPSVKERSRRHLLLGLTLATTLSSLAPGASSAAPALTSSVAPPAPADIASRLSAAFNLPMTAPEPVKFPRKALDQRFAVLLMRSSYDAVNALDFIPMESFEARFWKLRQSELEGYNLLYSPLKSRQGDLTDPLYFDFISFSQYSTISREMQRPAKVFEERYEDCPPGISEDEPCGVATRVVRRPQQFDEDVLLPAYFFETTGDLIYKGLRDGFRGEVFGGPPAAPRGASKQQLLQGVQQLLSIMVDKGYALKATVADVPNGGEGPGARGQFRVSIKGPANLWGLSALGARRALVANAFDVMVIAAWLRESGVQARHELEVTETGLEEMWALL